MSTLLYSLGAELLITQFAQNERNNTHKMSISTFITYNS